MERGIGGTCIVVNVAYQPFIWSQKHRHAGIDLANGEGHEHVEWIGRQSASSLNVAFL